MAILPQKIRRVSAVATLILFLACGPEPEPAASDCAPPGYTDLEYTPGKGVHSEKNDPEAPIKITVLPSEISKTKMLFSVHVENRTAIEAKIEDREGGMMIQGLDASYTYSPHKQRGTDPETVSIGGGSSTSFDLDLTGDLKQMQSDPDFRPGRYQITFFHNFEGRCDAVRSNTLVFDVR